MSSDPTTPAARNIHRSLTLSLGVALVLVVAVGLVVEKQTEKRNGGGESYGAVPEFSFMNQRGQPFGSADLKGKAWIADFIFTRCGGPCPLMTSRMARLQREFQGRSDVKFVSFTVDPRFDTPEVLSRYAARHGAREESWTFLTGDTARLYDLIQKNFHLAAQENKDGKPGEEVTHSLKFVLVDQNARIRGYYNGDEEKDMARLQKDIQALL